jgi:hypothetical protein
MCRIECDSRLTLVTLLSLAALMFTSCGLTPAAGNELQKTDDGKARSAIMAILKAHEEHWNRHDMDAWADTLLHEDSDWVNWRGEDLTFLSPDIALAHVRSELSGDERAPGRTFPYRKTILFTRQNGVWGIRALHNTRLLGVE